MTDKKTFVPKLRFPEFQNDGDWLKSKLIGLSNKPLSNGVFNDPKKVGTGFKLINVSDMYIETTIDEGRLSLLELPPSDFHANQVLFGDIFFTRSSLVASGIAASNIYLGSSSDVTFDGHLIRFRPDTSKVVPQFAHYLFKAAPIRAQLIARGKTATMTTIGQADVAGVTLFNPTKPEQQKIAECLSSLDELIAAQARKVDALKTHKKGLMQQLFPREGETQPRLRFPEFQNAGEWEVKALGQIFPITSSKRVHEADWTPTGVPFYRAREIVALNKRQPIQPLFISEELYAAHGEQTGEIRDGHLLVTGVGSIGVPYLVRAGDRFYFKDGNIIWLKNDGNVMSGEFLHRLYETDFVQKQLNAMADVGTVATYTIDNAKRTLAAFPKDKDEQKRIALFLSSLDAQVTAEVQKLAALKTHKKALMQQLFPFPEAVEA